MSHGGLMMNRLVGIACEGVGSIPLVKLLPKLTCEQVRPLIADFEKIDDTSVPWSEVLQNENRFARAQLGNYPNPIKLVSDLRQARDTRRASAERHDLAAAHLRLLIVELALRTYRCDQGKAPVNLTQLVPKYLQSLPKDPFSSNPLVYRPAGTNWVLYSLGPDRVDDGGKPVGKIISGDYLIGFGASKSGKGQNKGDLLYDSGW
jgi:Bacterial type II secretion system protein G.